MTTFNIFYNSNKEIVWTTTGDVNDAIKTAQSDLGYSYVQLTLEDIDINNYYINSDATGVTEKTAFDFTFSTTTPAVDEVINVTGLPAGTQVFLDGASQGTMSDTTLTLTTQEPGTYNIKFYKLHYKEHSGTTVISKRYGE
tara:strand:- start:350 stop:772 length:423 start_codon:yes stop_codon:yes gene_type:complete